jgi:flagellar basal body-associated protein FliL
MATQETAVEAPGDQPENAPPGTRAKLMPKITMLAVVLAVATVECLAAYFYIPSADDLAAAAGASIAAKAPRKPAEEVVEKPELKEVDMGEFRLTALQPLTNSNLRIDFKLFGMVTEEDQAEFAELSEVHKHRLRDQVISLVRGADMTDLTDAGLGLIRRRILETTNHTLGKPLLQAVIFSDFSVVEQ